MSKRDISGLICRPFCSFYREGEKEELICNGARLAEILLNKGILSPESIAGVEPGPWPASAVNAALDRSVCRQCPFRPDGCDFRSSAPPDDAEPCGGYILLSRMVEKGIISSDLIGENDDE